MNDYLIDKLEKAAFLVGAVMTAAGIVYSNDIMIAGGFLIALLAIFSHITDE